MQRGVGFFNQKQCFPCSVALVLGRGGAGRSAPMQRGVRFFQKRCFPCSVALVLGRGGGARRAPGELPCSVAFVSPPGSYQIIPNLTKSYEIRLDPTRPTRILPNPTKS